MNEIEGALAQLASRDPRTADDAGAALDWLVGDLGLGALSQEGLQTFLWYGLPMKWMADGGRHRQVAAALAEVLDLLGMARYAAICRSPATAEILAAYERRTGEGKKAMRRAAAASGIDPPGLDEFAWGPIMGSVESAAWSSTADLLELAVAGGELVVGAKGWKARQVELVHAHLTTPRIELRGSTWLDAVRAERIETWLTTRSPTRQRLLAPLADRLAEPCVLDPGIVDPVPPLRWLLEQLTEPQPLTQSGYLPTALVSDAAARGWWDDEFRAPPRSEADLIGLGYTRDIAARAGLVRKSAKTLGLTPRGRSVMGDPVQLARSTARALVSNHRFDRSIATVTLAALLSAEVTNYKTLRDLIGAVLAEEGWRDPRTNEPPGIEAIVWMMHSTLNVLRSLQLLTDAGDGVDSSYELVDAGRFVAFDALHRMATGPLSLA